MTRLLPFLAALSLAACATNLDMTSSKDRLDVLSGRIDILEKAVAKSAGMSASQSQQGTDRAAAMEKEVADLRLSYADQQAAIAGFTEKLDALAARVAELENAQGAQVKRNLTGDKSLESLAVKLEAEIRELGEQLKKLAAPKP